MPLRRRRSGSRRSGRRRQLVWAVTNTFGTTLAANTDWVNFDLLAQLRTAGASVLGVTIMRSIVRIAPTSAPPAGDAFTFALGVQRSNDIGANTGISPIGNLYEDWLWYDTYMATPAPGSTAAFNRWGTQVIDVDTRSMRKCQEMEQRYILSVQPNITTSGLTFDLFTRVLVALP